MALDKSYLKQDQLPTIFCAGCGHGIVTQAFLRAMKSMGWDKDNVIAVSGIGCSARIPSYPDVNGIQCTHGRALAFATGMKMASPEKDVVLFLGDGDCSAIGGNHFLHSCRRNIDMTVLVLNNYIYGMTGGQTSPTTPTSSITKTSPYGNIENDMDICSLAEAAGATFVARSTAYHALQLPGLMVKAFKNKGLSVLEIMCPCPTGYGSRNNIKSMAENYDFLKNASISRQEYAKLSDKDKVGKIETGIFKQADKPEYIEQYQALCRRVKGDISRDVLALEKNSGQPVERFECQFAGSGGQGLILGGIILAEAMIRQGKYAVHTQSYGPAARGGSSKSEVIISDRDINFPEVTRPDLFVAMTQEAYDKYHTGVTPGCIVLTDSTYVKADPIPGAVCCSFPVSEMCADKLGNVRSANVMLLGIIAGMLDFVDYAVLHKSVLARLAPKLHDLNAKALELGYALGRSVKEPVN